MRSEESKPSPLALAKIMIVCLAKANFRQHYYPSAKADGNEYHFFDPCYFSGIAINFSISFIDDTNHGASLRTTHPSFLVTYSILSCIRFSRPCQNSNNSGMRRKPPQ